MDSFLPELQAAILILFSLVTLRAVKGPFLFDDPGIFTLPFESGYPWNHLRANCYLPPAPWLLHLSYRLNWKLSGFDDTRSWHIVNTLLHSANVLLVWGILRHVWPEGAFWSSAVFAVHPLHTSAAAYISGRGNLQSLAFTLAGVLLALNGWVWFALPCVLAAWSTRRDAWVYLGYFTVLFLGAR